MKLIALTNIYRVPALADVQVEGAKRPNHIHKGAVFEIGKADKLEDLRKDEKVLVAQLYTAHCVGGANDPKLVAQVQAEVEAEQRREANHAKRDAELRQAGIAQQLADVLCKLAAKK